MNIEKLEAGFICLMVGGFVVLLAYSVGFASGAKSTRDEAIEAGAAHRVEGVHRGFIWRGEAVMHEGRVWHFRDDGTVDHYDLEERSIKPEAELPRTSEPQSEKPADGNG